MPKDRPLVFEAVQGWAPLCAFLGVPVPDTPFARENSRADCQLRVHARSIDGRPDPTAVQAMLDRAKRR